MSCALFDADSRAIKAIRLPLWGQVGEALTPPRGDGVVPVGGQGW